MKYLNFSSIFSREYQLSFNNSASFCIRSVHTDGTIGFYFSFSKIEKLAHTLEKSNVTPLLLNSLYPPRSDPSLLQQIFTCTYGYLLSSMINSVASHPNCLHSLLYLVSSNISPLLLDLDLPVKCFPFRKYFIRSAMKVQHCHKRYTRRLWFERHCG